MPKRSISDWLNLDESPHDRIATQAEKAPTTSLSRFGHWLYHAPMDWLLSRSCFPAAAVVAGVALAGLLVTVPYATPLLIANWAIPVVALGVRAVAHRRWSLFSRPQAHQVSCVAASPQDPVELEHDHSGHDHGGVSGRLARPSHIINALGKLTRAAERGNPVAKVLDDWLNERSQIYSLAAESLILGLGFGLGAPWMATFAVQMLFHNIPDILSFYVGARTHEARRVFRPGMFQRRTTVASMKKELETPNRTLHREKRGESMDRAAPKRPVVKRRQRQGRAFDGLG